MTLLGEEVLSVCVVLTVDITVTIGHQMVTGKATTDTSGLNPYHSRLV